MRFRKGELNFYKGMTPKELKKYIQIFKANKKYVDYFIENYRYNYVKKVWIKNVK